MSMDLERQVKTSVLAKKLFAAVSKELDTAADGDVQALTMAVLHSAAAHVLVFAKMIDEDHREQYMKLLVPMFVDMLNKVHDKFEVLTEPEPGSPVN